MSLIHTVWQCSDAACTLRFPSTGEHVTVSECPMCGQPIRVAARHGSQFVPTALSRPNTTPVVAMLDNVRSLRNVGAIFRTADAAGIKQLYLAGITATPENPKLAKTALGAEKVVAWNYGRNGVAMAHALRDLGYEIWVVEGGDSAESLLSIEPPAQPTVVVLGNETAGVDPAIIDMADKLLAIPMRGIKQSLNVATAFGVMAYALTVQA